MTQRYYPFDAGAGANVTEDQWTNMGRRWLMTGVIKGVPNFLQGFADSTGMQVKLNTGFAWVDGHLYHNDAIETLAIAANSSGNPRRDLLVLRRDKAANTIVAAIVQGTPAASPSDPALTQVDGGIWEIPIARVDVANGASNIAAGNVVDYRFYTGNPVGEISHKVRTADLAVGTAGSGAPVLDTTLTTGSIWFPGGRAVKISFIGNMTSNVSGDRSEAAVTEDGNIVYDAVTILHAAAEWHSFFGMVRRAPSQGLHTYQMRYWRRSGTGSLTLECDPAIPATLLVEDIGPA